MGLRVQRPERPRDHDGRREAVAHLIAQDTLTAARISGRREYHGDITADHAWPQIITADQSDQLCAF